MFLKRSFKIFARERRRFKPCKLGETERKERHPEAIEYIKVEVVVPERQGLKEISLPVDGEGWGGEERGVMHLENHIKYFIENRVKDEYESNVLWNSTESCKTLKKNVIFNNYSEKGGKGEQSLL